MNALAIDLGGTHANCGIVRDQQVLCSQVVRISGDGRLEHELPALANTLRNLAAYEKLHLSDFDGVAIGFCGLVNRMERRVTSTNSKYQDAPDLDLPAWARDQLELPLSLENDARMALLGEWYAGAAKGCDDVVMITLGTGIGGAVMMGGRLLTGRHFQAGCLGGHLTIRVDGDACTCGGVGCAESEAAGWSLPGLCRRWRGFEASALAHVELNFETLFRCADAGDAVASAVRNHCLQVWAANAISLVHAYDPELLVYGGGVMRSGRWIADYIQENVARHAWTPWGKVQVRTTTLGDNAALLGAVPLITNYERSNSDVR